MHLPNQKSIQIILFLSLVTVTKNHFFLFIKGMLIDNPAVVQELSSKEHEYTFFFFKFISELELIKREKQFQKAL